MFNCGQQEIRRAAHIAAQKVALTMDDGHYHDPNCTEPKEMRKRIQALNWMKESGFGSFLYNEDGAGVQPVSHGTSTPEHGESWTHWAVFNVSEVKAYMAFKEIEEEDDVVKHGAWCPDCSNAKVYYSQDTGYTRCPECRSQFTARPNDDMLNACERIFGCRHYGGPGRVFTEDTHGRITSRGTRILVTQYGGYDI